MDKSHLKRVREELKTAGVGRMGLHTPESKALAQIIHENEHIGGVIYGRYSNGLAWLIATDQRVIFIDRKPFFTTTDELTYDVVSGVKLSHAGLFSAVTLHTRVSEYALRFVSHKSARIFVKYIETRRLEHGAYDQATGRYTLATDPVPEFQSTDNAESLSFLKSHDSAVLSTVDRTGNVQGAVVYYLVDQHDFVYILTKSETGKGRNVYAHSQVALTVHEAGTLRTLQLQGTAEVETDQKVKEDVFSQIVKPRTYRGKTSLPPVVKLDKGAYMVIKISPTAFNFHDYAK